MSQQSSEPIVYLEAISTGRGPLGGGPSYAKLAVSSHFRSQLRRLQDLCAKNALNEVRISYAPDMWGPEGAEEEMRLESPELVVTKTDFWFTDRGRHSDGLVETRAVSMKELFEALASASGPVYLGVYPEDLKRDVLGDSPDEADGEGEGEAEAFR